MPITFSTKIEPLTQGEFAKVAYDFMECAFAIHQELGRLFDEKVYQQALAQRVPGMQAEVPVEVTFEDFRKTYFIDALVGSGALFELKAVEKLHERHQGQLLHYLLLAGLHHGKLVNFRPERVEHEFINTRLTRADRTSFAVEASAWREFDPSHRRLRLWLTEALHDWGVGLELSLCRDAVIHLFGGKENAVRLVEVVSCGQRIGWREVVSPDPTTAVEITALPSASQATFKEHLHRFLAHTTLSAVQWINLTRGQVTFRTICRDGTA